ncbi:hypothetical protein [uncultured Methanobrevibacter sp.]|uniref:hypothetical protein n=1 Tax=uncultured Methanobrevibacter sp. TaxID=253161 RepID=UPI0025EE7B7B|nr:hypothetical protein [uncultured Methanobrevibacter sp.]
MKKVVSKKTVVPQEKVPQLLDTKTDYNNYSDLSYFISQYNKAVEIIKECNTFYSNFLRNKLFTKKDIMHTSGINMLGMKFNISEFVENATKLYEFFIYKVLSKEFAENLKKYQYNICDADAVFNKYGEVSGRTKFVYCIEPCNGGIPMGYDYFNFLINTFCKKDGKIDDFFEDESHYSVGSYFFDKVLAQYVHNDDVVDEEIHNFSKINDTTGQIVTDDGKIIKVKIKQLERFGRQWNNKTLESEWKSTEKFDTFIVFGDEELKMIEILKNFHKKYKNVRKDILVNPGNYTDLWEEYINTIVLNEKFLNKELQERLTKSYCGAKRVRTGTKYVYKVDKAGEYFVKREKFFYSDKAAHVFMFAPVDYILCSEKQEDEDDFKECVYSIDAVNFLNNKLLNIKFLKFDDEDDFEVEDEYSDMYDLADSFYINKHKLQLKIEEIHPRTLNAATINADYLLDENWYYVLIDNTPYPFSNNLRKVKITHNKEKNILECKYEHETRRKKAPWPGWMPWIVTTHYYKLFFSCNTNEPVFYRYIANSVEESCK